MYVLYTLPVFPVAQVTTRHLYAYTTLTPLPAGRVVSYAALTPSLPPHTLSSAWSVVYSPSQHQKAALWVAFRCPGMSFAMS